MVNFLVIFCCGVIFMSHFLMVSNSYLFTPWLGIYWLLSPQSHSSLWFWNHFFVLKSNILQRLKYSTCIYDNTHFSSNRSAFVFVRLLVQNAILQYLQEVPHKYLYNEKLIEAWNVTKSFSDEVLNSLNFSWAWSWYSTNNRL
jgi:hypothetical protein